MRRLPSLTVQTALIFDVHMKVFRRKVVYPLAPWGGGVGVERSGRSSVYRRRSQYRWNGAAKLRLFLKALAVTRRCIKRLKTLSQDPPLILLSLDENLVEVEYASLTM